MSAKMSVTRAIPTLTSSTSLFFRFASPPTASSSRPCQHAIRYFTSSQRSSQNGSQSAKRKMQTSTVYHPYSLDAPPPPPPRNAPVPDTSIAGSIPQVNDTRPPLGASAEEVIEADQPRSTVGFPEREAQRSIPVAATAPSMTPKPSAKPRPKLRARKAAMKLTPGAVEQLRALLDQPDPKLIKVGVKNRGCSGLAYHLEYVEKPGLFDEAVEQDGVKVLIDSKALFSIIGSEMDWVEDKLNRRFVFKNPNIKEQCGCGESFMV